ncbi:hypothetical protein HDU97_001951 [Phlyctochytrium planicorne]|nr:hypothetical protein HDU97_001951 [Phlyctochytrium planicorne]
MLESGNSLSLTAFVRLLEANSFSDISPELWQQIRDMAGIEDEMDAMPPFEYDMDSNRPRQEQVGVGMGGKKLRPPTSSEKKLEKKSSQKLQGFKALARRLVRTDSFTNPEPKRVKTSPIASTSVTLPVVNTLRFKGKREKISKPRSSKPADHDLGRKRDKQHLDSEKEKLKKSLALTVRLRGPNVFRKNSQTSSNTEYMLSPGNVQSFIKK